MNCTIGKLVEFSDMLGHWVFEPCPYHGRRRDEVENCSVCDDNGEVEIFIECGEKHGNRQRNV